MKKDWMIKESELDEDQIRVLMATLDKSCIVSGCAGSGKSVLALIKAQRIQKEKGKNYQIIVFTKALCNYMNSGKNELGLTNPFYLVCIFDWGNSIESVKLDAPLTLSLYWGKSNYLTCDFIPVPTACFKP